MGIEGFTRTRDKLLRIAGSEAGLADVLDSVLIALHEVTAFSWCAVMTVDPQTLLPTSGVVEGFEPSACAPFWDHELLSPGFNKFNVLARSTDSVATLVGATDGDLERAPIYSHLYADLDVADELRAVFNIGSTCWGIAVLVRAAADGPFPDHEVDAIRSLSPIIARAMRASTSRLEQAASTPAAMIVVDRYNIASQMTVHASDLLDDLRTAGVNEIGLPAVVGAAVTRARSSRSSTQLITRMRGRSGRWLRVTAAPMTSDDGSVAVILEPARASDLAPILLESMGLTPREIDIVMLLARGLAVKQIATEIGLSAHTVRDHVKSIYDKVGVSSRGELVAQIFSDHLLTSFEQAVHRVGA